MIQEAQITLECIIVQKFHRTVMGPKGSKVQHITMECEVGIKFPNRPTGQEGKTPKFSSPTVSKMYHLKYGLTKLNDSICIM